MNIKKKICVAVFAVAMILCLCTAFLIARPAEAAVSAEPLGVLTLKAEDIESDVLLTDSFTFGQPSSASCGQSPLSFKISDDSKNPRFEMKMGTDFTYGEANTSITLRRKFLTDLSEGLYWLNFETATGDKEYVLDLRGEGNWVVNEKKGSYVTDGNTTKINLNGWTGDYNTDGRARYTEALDVTKPIRIAVSNLDTGNWLMLALDKNPYAAEYMSETDTTPGVVKILDMAKSSSTGEPERLQGFAGFLQQTGVLPISSLLHKNNLNLFEIYIGETAAESYLKVNGSKIIFGETIVKRSDFPENKAYLSLYASETTSFSVASVVNGPVAYFSTDVPETDYSSKTDQDLSFLVAGAESGLKLRYKNSELTLGTDYTFDEAAKLVTVTGDYLKSLSYANTLVFEIESDGVKGDVRFSVQLSYDSTAGVAEGESDIKFYEGSDVSFRLNLGSESYMGVIDYQTGEALSESAVSFNGGTLVFSAQTLQNMSAGTYIYLVETDISLFPIVIVRENFVYGAADLLGNSDYSVSCGRFISNGTSSVIMNTMFDLSKGVEFLLDISETGAYYLNGQASGDPDSCIELSFLDVFTGNRLVIRVRANAAADNDGIRYKTWIDFSIADAEGNALSSQTRIFSRENTVGSHTLKVEYTENRFVLTFGDETPVTLAAGDTLPDSMQFTVGATEGFKFVMGLSGVDYSALISAVDRAAKTSGGSAFRTAYENAAHLRFGADQKEVDAATEALLKQMKGGGLAVWLPVGISAGVVVIAAVILVVVFANKKRKTNENQSQKQE